MFHLVPQMMKFSTALLALTIPAALLPGMASAQAPTPPPPKNLIYNGGFETFWQVDNLWDGVDNDNYLAGARGTVRAIKENGTVDNLSMPLSVQAVDMNGDGLIDLVTCDGDDIFRVYFNSGTPTEPKFTHAETIPIYLSQLPFRENSLRKGYKVGVYDLSRTGAKDLILGNYGGELMILKNMGSSRVPDFRQPQNIDQLVVKTNKAGTLWGNLFAPIVADFTGSGRFEFLIGDGGYSANNIHIFLNQGSGVAPKLTEENRFYLAYGDGREQLIPTVVDFNGDGFPDLIVGDRKGNLNLYLSDGKWDKHKELKFSTTIPLGTVKDFRDNCVSPCVADLNGDGLFDIIIGKTNGRIAVAYNIGTKEQPKFGNPVELKGTDIWNRTTTRNPSDWDIDFGKTRGNLFGYYTVVNETDDPKAAPIPEKKSVFKAGYFTPPNKIIRFQPLVISPTAETGKIMGMAIKPNEVPTLNAAAGRGHTAIESGAMGDSNTLILRKVLENDQVKSGVNYNFSFKVKGQGVTKALWHLSYSGYGERSEATVVKSGDRNGVIKKRDAVSETIKIENNFTAPAQWTTISKPVKFVFVEQKDLNDPSKFIQDPKPRYRAILEIRILLRPGEGTVYLDDVQLIAQ